MSQRPTQTQDYWEKDFDVQQDDIDRLYNILLERETPLSADEMALVLVRYRVQKEDEEQVARPRPGGNVYRPDEQYDVGDEFILPQFHDVKGQVTETRAGDNPDYGDFTVITVETEEGKYDLASQLSLEHALSIEEEIEEEPDEDLIPPEELFIEYGGFVADVLEERLEEHEDLVRLAGSWFPRSLLADVNVGHLNLAEAVLDMYGGGPMSTPEILEQIGKLEGVNERLAEFSMNYALQQDERFDEVGPAGQVLWFLVRMEPDEVRTPPERLAYDAVDFDPATLTPELTELVRQIGDEHSAFRRKRGVRVDQVTVTLTYPHRRAGTLPLSHQLRRMFPTAYQAPRIRFIIVDGETGDEIPGWVVRPGGYVYGLKGWFDRHDIPAGAYLTVERLDSEGRVRVGYEARNTRKEWVRTALVDDNRLRFEEQQRELGCGYDDLMIVDVPEPDALDDLWEKLKDSRSLDRVVLDVAQELAGLMTQGNIHAKTLYAAVNVIRRCPPGPIFVVLMALPQFEHVGGPYWRLASDDPEE